MGASYEMSYASTYIPTINDPAVVDLGKNIAKKVLGPSGWTELENPSMGGEDFAYYIRKYPGAMFRIGMGKESAPLHNARFDFNDDALKNGILFLASTALEFLEYMICLCLEFGIKEFSISGLSPSLHRPRCPQNSGCPDQPASPRAAGWHPSSAFPSFAVSDWVLSRGEVGLDLFHLREISCQIGLRLFHAGFICISKDQ